jgi:hypothetical protein
LITIFSDEWITKQDICKQAIRSILGVGGVALHARKMDIKQVSPSDAQEFLNENHMLGYTIGSHIGLYQNKTIQALITYSADNGGVELLRFCVKNRVNGAFSRLLKYLRVVTLGPIKTFSDNRWSDGGLYIKHGFKLDGLVRPDYWYTKGDKLRENKGKFRKSKILGILPGETEWVAMQRLGYDRIWDCGKKRWILE